jgi:hypothetical protein
VTPGGEVVEHKSSRAGRWLREKRLRAALWIALIEGILVAFHVISWWIAVVAAAVLVMFYFWAGRRLGSHTARQVSWIGAVSQALVVLVPILVKVVGALSLIAVGIIAVLALVALFAERR